MPKDRFKAKNDRERVQQERQEEVGGRALVLRTTWRATNEQQRRRIADLLADLPDEERWSTPRRRLLEWQSYLAQNAEHTLARRFEKAMRAIEMTRRLQRNGKEPRPFQPRGRSRTFIPAPLKKAARPAWMSDPTLLPKAPPKPGASSQ